MKFNIKDFYYRIIYYLHRKSIERLTIMFIPHGNDKIYSFHLSWLMILFLFFVFSSLSGISLYGYYRYKEISDKIKELKSLYGKNYQNIYDIQTSLIRLQNISQNAMKTNLYQFYHVYHGEIAQDIVSVSYTDAYQKSYQILNQEILQKQELTPGTKYLKATYLSSGLKQFYSYQYHVLKLIENVILEKMQLVTTIPNGRPVKIQHFRDTSPFGLRLDPLTKSHFELHAGIDMAGKLKTPIYATADGVVEKVFYSAGYGYAIMIRHPSHYITLYAHLFKPLVKSRQIIKKGQMIGQMGATGRVTGVHLHYEVLLPDQDRVDPLPFVCLTDLKTKRCKKWNEYYRNE